MAGRDKRLPQLMPVNKCEHNTGKERVQDPVVNQEPRKEVEEEREEGELVHDESPRAAAVAAAAEALGVLVPGSPPQIDVRVDMMLLHCHACLLPLKPPVFKCESGHVMCHCCRGRHDEVCCCVTIQCGELDAIICASKVPCPYKALGCDSYVAYHEADAHMSECHYAPCACPEHGCGFLGSPSALLDHFAAVHSWPIIVIHYGCPWNLSLPLSQRWHVIVGQEDQSVFLVTLGELGGASTAVSLVCVRADDGTAAAPQFWCKLSVEHPGGDKDKVALMASAVSSSTMSSGAPMPWQGMFLAVPRELISGDMLVISVRIDQVQSVDAATMTKTMPPPHAKTTRRLH